MSETFDKDLSKATQGMDYSEAAKLADKLGISISKFRQSGNKFYLDSYDTLEDYYFGEQNKEIASLKESMDTEIANLIKLDPNSILERLGENWEQDYNTLVDTVTSDNILNQLSEAHVDKDRLKSLIQDWKTNGSDQDFMEYISNKFGEEYASNVEAMQKSWQYSIASSYLANGNIKGFVQATEGERFREEAIKQLTEEGKLQTEEAISDKDIKAKLRKEGKVSTTEKVTQIEQL